MKITSAATSMDDDMDLGLALYQTGETEEEFFAPLLAELQKDVDNYNELQKCHLIHLGIKLTLLGSHSVTIHLFQRFIFFTDSRKTQLD